jgi:hypothetical protein
MIYVGQNYEWEKMFYFMQKRDDNKVWIKRELDAWYSQADFLNMALEMIQSITVVSGRRCLP